MFLTELTPIIKEMTQNPVAFLGGFCAGAFGLSLAEDPLKSWLNKQGIQPHSAASTYNQNNGPQTISIE
jgi:hypothetical protein